MKNPGCSEPGFFLLSLPPGAHPTRLRASQYRADELQTGSKQQLPQIKASAFARIPTFLNACQQKLRVEINEEKSRIIDLAKGGSFAFLGFEHRRVLGRNRKWRAQFVPKLKKRTALFGQAQGNLPTTRPPTGREGDGDDQSHPTRWGELFPDRAFGSRLLEDPRRGRKGDPASSDAGPMAPRPGLETVE